MSTINATSMMSSRLSSRKAFSGNTLPCSSRVVPSRRQAAAVAPQALFTKNKQKNPVSRDSMSKWFCRNIVLPSFRLVGVTFADCWQSIHTSASLACCCLAQRQRSDRSAFALQKKTRTDTSAKEVDPSTPAFTRRREVFAGRLAMFGFAASLIGEVNHHNASPCWNDLHMLQC